MAKRDARTARETTERTRAVDAWLRARSGEMLELLEELIAYPTENPPGGALGACGRRLQQALTALGLRGELIELPPARELEEPCLVRGAAGEGARTIYFHGHFDVVPAQSRAQFRPRRQNGAIVGRGSADMKGGLVSMLYGAAAARELGLLDDTKVVLHFVCDEETGSAAGSAYLRDNGLIDPHALAMLTAEPTGGSVWHASRGAITMRVRVHGREAHVGRVHLGDNAFEKMLAVARPLVELSHELLEKRTAFPAETDAARGSMLVVGRSGRGRELQRRPRERLVLGRPSLQPRGRPRGRGRTTDPRPRAGCARRRCPDHDRAPAAGAVRPHRCRRSSGPRARGVDRSRGASRARVRPLPRSPRDALVRAGRDSRLRLRPRAARRLARPGRARRRGRSPSLRRRLRALSRRGLGFPVADMTPPRGGDAKLLLRVYPRRRRERYGDDLLAPALVVTASTVVVTVAAAEWFGSVTWNRVPRRQPRRAKRSAARREEQPWMSTILPSRTVSTWNRSRRRPSAPSHAVEPMILSPTSVSSGAASTLPPPRLCNWKLKTSRASSGPRHDGVCFHHR